MPPLQFLGEYKIFFENYPSQKIFSQKFSRFFFDKKKIKIFFYPDFFSSFFFVTTFFCPKIFLNFFFWYPHFFFKIRMGYPKWEKFIYLNQDNLYHNCQNDRAVYRRFFKWGYLADSELRLRFILTLSFGCSWVYLVVYL